MREAVIQDDRQLFDRLPGWPLHEKRASVVANETKVRVFSAELAVVTGLYTATFRHPVGKESSGRYRYTDVWVLRAGSWQCVATQETQVP